MIFGSGTKTRQWTLSDGRVLVLVWRYSHFFFCPIAHHLSWHVLGDKRSEDKKISREEAINLMSGVIPEPSFWEMRGGYVLTALIFLAVVWSKSR
ncbi:MAG: hypothetical protein EXS46_00870 [Candidatus Taylorbacteria bacterium]|nr:hypothetical protein [Candidatus Taylorbacteria bacterium]